MKALLSHIPGGPETLRIEELADPVAGPGEVLVRVRACSVNYPDVLIIEDKYQVRPPRPFAPGCEIAGEIAALGQGVGGDGAGGWAVGDRVIAATGHGGMAEQVAVPASGLFRLPSERGFTEGAALILTYGTTIHALVDRGRLAAGQTLLVLGAAGGVGLAAVELGKALGARVVAAVSSPEKADAARQAGADVIYDPVGGDYTEPALRAIAWEGRYLVVGFPAGIPKLPLNLTLLKSCDVCGVFWGAFAARDPAANRAHIDRLFALWRDGKIAPRVTRTFSLAQGGQAIAAMAARTAIGKLVVEV